MEGSNAGQDVAGIGQPGDANNPPQTGDPSLQHQDGPTDGLSQELHALEEKASRVDALEQENEALRQQLEEERSYLVEPQHDDDAPNTTTIVENHLLAAVHQFLATLSGPEATRAAALRAQLPQVPA